MWDHLNDAREEIIKKISEAQAEACNKLEAINDIKTNKTTKEILEKLFSNRFLFIIQINSLRFLEEEENIEPLKLLLIETFFTSTSHKRSFCCKFFFLIFLNNIYLLEKISSVYQMMVLLISPT